MLADLAHDRFGAGRPVVLIHGIGHRRQAWAPIVPALAERFEVITIDLAGFGESPAFPSAERYNMDNACRHLAEQFERWGLVRPHVVGNSLGGAIALELASRDIVSSAVALSPAGFFGRFDRLQALGILSLMRLSAFAPDAVLRFFASHELGRRVIGGALYAHPGRHDFASTYGDALALKRCQAFGAVAVEGLRYVFSAPYPIDVPTTVAWGTKDRILPYSQAARARHQLPGADHVPLVGAGHVPMIDAPDTIVRLIEETIARADDRAVA